MRTSKVISLSMPPEAAQEFEELAEELQRSKSDVFREMLTVFKKFRLERAHQEDVVISAMVANVIAEAQEEKRLGTVPTPEAMDAEWETWKNSDESKRIQQRLKERGVTEEMIIEGNYGDR